MCHNWQTGSKEVSEWFGSPEKEAFMSAFLASFIQYAVKFIILAAIALAGIVCGKKFRDKRNNQ